MSAVTRSLSKAICSWHSAKRVSALNNFNQRASYAEVADTENVPDPERVKYLNRIRNISRLNTINYNKYHGIPPYMEAMFSYQKTLRWKRRQYGLYGAASGVDPGVCFATKEEREEWQEYEKVAFDKSWLEIRQEALRKMAEQNEECKLREERVIENLGKSQALKQEIRNRLAKKTVEASVAKKERERLLEEVRRYFGYRIDLRDEKFQIMLDIKEKEQRRAAKLAKKQRKEEIFMKRLAALGTPSSDSSPSSTESTAVDEKSNADTK